MEPQHRKRRIITTSALDQLNAIEKALSDPRRLVDTVSTADDDDQAIVALMREFELTEQEAYVVLLQQFRQLTRAGKITLQSDIARRQAEAENDERESDQP